MRSRTETWARRDIEHLFDVSRASAQALMKAIGQIQAVGGAHFVERASLLRFLDEMIQADSVEEALLARMLEADAPPAPKSLRITLPPDLRNVSLLDLPKTIRLEPGSLHIEAPNCEAMLESLALLARALQNDLAGAQSIWDPAPVRERGGDSELQRLLSSMRASADSS